MIGPRKFKELAAAVLEYRHYKALLNMWRLYPDFLQNIWRYVTGKGVYPYDLRVKTPEGMVSMRLYSYHDILTANEIFCRRDYPAGSDVQFVVDIGSNIGISALYFLSRNNNSKCILYEPVPKNVERLKLNLRGLESRYLLVEAAVAAQSGKVTFGVESTGRYGGIGVRTEESITVDCVHINDALRDALRSFSRIDIVKLDTEGAEVTSVEAIDSNLLHAIQRIYLEANPQGELQANLFRNRQYGSVRQLIRYDAR